MNLRINTEDKSVRDMQYSRGANIKICGPEEKDDEDINETFTFFLGRKWNYTLAWRVVRI